MKTIVTRFLYSVSVTAVLGSLLLAPVSSRGEGGAVGSGGAPPPKILCVTPDYVLYDNGFIVYADGTSEWLH